MWTEVHTTKLCNLHQLPIFMHNLTPTQAQEQIKTNSGELLDVRTASEYEAGYIQNAQNIDFLSGEFERTIPTLDKNKTYYLYCKSGGRSGKATDLLLAAGFEKVYNIGGFEMLAAAGFPVEY